MSLLTKLKYINLLLPSQRDKVMKKNWPIAYGFAVKPKYVHFFNKDGRDTIFNLDEYRVFDNFLRNLDWNFKDTMGNLIKIIDAHYYRNDAYNNSSLDLGPLEKHVDTTTLFFRDLYEQKNFTSDSVLGKFFYSVKTLLFQQGSTRKLVSSLLDFEESIKNIQQLYAIGSLSVFDSFEQAEKFNSPLRWVLGKDLDKKLAKFIDSNNSSRVVVHNVGTYKLAIDYIDSINEHIDTFKALLDKRNKNSSIMSSYFNLKVESKKFTVEEHDPYEKYIKKVTALNPDLALFNFDLNDPARFEELAAGISSSANRTVKETEEEIKQTQEKITWLLTGLHHTLVRFNQISIG